MTYLQEWAASAVDPQLTRLNVRELAGDRVYDYLLYGEDIPRRNDGRLRAGWLERYAHVTEGGWWCSGVDLLSGDDDAWGCFKPVQPRCHPDTSKVIKYEHPPKVATGLFALRVTLPVWQRIADRYHQVIPPEAIDPQRPDRGFWRWVQERPEIPICLTEGAKKAGALLSAGYVAIALPGVNNGYRTPRDEFGHRNGKSHLIPPLAVLAVPDRPFYIAFDQDSKPTTIKAVNAAIRHTGYLLAQRGCAVKVVTWLPALGKGVDDLIAQQGAAAFEAAYEAASSLDLWKAQTLNQLTYSPDVEVHDRYLPSLTIPDTVRLIGIKSPKGTGKTQFLEGVVQQAIARGQWVLVIGHRIRLVEALCQRFDLSYISDVREDRDRQQRGYGLCIDSLHPNSQAAFEARDWSNGVVIIDEVEQVLWHGLNSGTCRNQRVSVLKSLKLLLQNVLGGSGQVYAADADLSDTSLDYLLALAGVEQQPYIIENRWQPNADQAWQVYHYPDKAPQRLLSDLEQHIAAGGRPFVCLSAQKLKSEWGTRNLESYLSQRFPQAKILRIDSESLANPTHPAHGCITQLNEVLGQYDVVLASPSIETGVSIDLQGHFTSVWAIAQGVQSENSVRQSLGRLREPVPRYLWVASHGLNKVGNGATSIPALLNSGQRLTQLNIRLLQQLDADALDDIDTGFQAESLLCWAKFAVRTNAAMANYRESILAALAAEGHCLQAVPEAPPAPALQPAEASPAELAAAVAAVRDANYQAECEAIASAADLTSAQYQVLRRQLVKLDSERRSCRKYQLYQRYGLPVTPALVVKDDQGWYQQLRLHYFLTVGRSRLAERDAAMARRLLKDGDGTIFVPDFNESQLGVAIGALEVLGISALLATPERELRNGDPDLLTMAELAQANRDLIRAALGVGLGSNYSPVTIARRFLELLGYGLKLVRCEGDRIQRIRVYQVVPPQDERLAVFRTWLYDAPTEEDTSAA